MKKDSTAKVSPQARTKKEDRQIRHLAAQQRLTVGLDLGDRQSHYCILDEAGEVVSEGPLATTKTGLNSLFEKMPSSRVALEVGTHSPWVSRHLAGWGHEVIVANPYKLKLITQSVRKNDRVDAQKLARLARVDPKLLSPIRHRSEGVQADLAVIRARAELMEARTALVNAARGLAKPLGERLKKCDADQVREALAEGLSEAAKAVLGPLLRSVAALSEQIGEYDRQIEEIAKRYPEVELLTQVYGVGKLIGLTYLLTIEDPARFPRSREVGPYLGLVPKERDSGASQPELSISKCGDRLLRSYLVQAAHCILRAQAPDSDLRRWGLEKMGKAKKQGRETETKKGNGKRNGKKAKRRALVGVARKLSVLLHRLWVTREVYDPLHHSRTAARGQRAAAA